MREDLLHFIWKYKKLALTDLATTKGEAILLIETGTHNHLAGPDFFNARMKINGQLWAGNVEVHCKSSDWYAHMHQNDTNYDSVVLHVVWSDDLSVFRNDGSEIPTLELKKYISKELLKAYQNLFDKKQKTFINCEKHINQIDLFLIQNWLDRLYFERLEDKAQHITVLLQKSKNNWERVMFQLLLKNFGLNINGASFENLANTIDFSIIRKLQGEASKLESLFFGMSILLENDTVYDTYFFELKSEFKYLKAKFGLDNSNALKPDFFKLRPANFPTIRLSQLANLYAQQQHLFDKLINASSIEEIYSLFDVKASDYWDSHFTFGKSSKISSKKLTKSFIDLLVINTILPLKFCYAKYSGLDVNERILTIMTSINAEKNTITSNFKKHGLVAKNSKDSQAILQLYKKYCTKNKCLSCAIGCSLLKK